MTAYLDFDVEIGEGSGRDYPMAVRSPAGETRATMHFPFDELQLDSRLKDLQIALLRSGGKRRMAPTREEQTVQDFGHGLFDALMIGDVRSLYDQSRAQATRAGQGLRLRLHIASPRLAALPWEFLYDARQNQYACLSISTPLVRYVELPHPPLPLAVSPPLRILGMIARPSDLPALDVDRERARVEQALREPIARGVVELEWLAGQTWRDLQRAMRHGPWHVFHFVGHGAFHADADEGLIMLADEAGRSHALRATELGRLLADHRSLRLVVLNACEGAKGGEQDIFSSTASILVWQGLPAVLAMQYDITDRAAVELSRTFYEALAEGLPVDAAVAEARKAVSLAVTNTIEWGAPVLYMRAPDGILFDVARRKPPAEAALAVAPAPIEVETAQAAPGAEVVSTAVLPREQTLPPVKRLPSGRIWLLAGLAGVIIAAVILYAILTSGGQPGEGPRPPSMLPATSPGAGPAAGPMAPPYAAPGLPVTFTITEPVTMELVWVPAGEFTIGSDTSRDSEASSDEAPQHPVDLPEFYIGRTEVTNAQYVVFAAATGRGVPESWPNGRILPGKEDHPVVDVSWHDATAFAEWLGGASGLRCRLPTEAEWEKACRGTDERIYPWGDAPRSSDLANYGRAVMDTTPAGSYSVQGDSAYGAADMVGNVWEWTSSAHTPYPYDARDGREDPGPAIPRVIRGGSFWDEAETGRCAFRGDWLAAEFDYRLGFRVLCQLDSFWQPAAG